MAQFKTTLLCILDGFGYREDSADNAIKLAKTPVYDRWWQTRPRAWLQTSGLAVGLPDGQMGNSEVGHMNIGGGRVVMQDLPRIDAAFADDSIKKNETLEAFIQKIRATGGKAHVFGLMSPGGVHSHMDHMAGLASVLHKAGLEVVIHAVSDGRDTPPQSALDYLAEFETEIEGTARIGSIGGRYFAMDRDNRWDRVEKAYTAMMRASGAKATNARAAIEEAYAAGISDEFIEPVALEGYDGFAPTDGLLIANFRSDRVRQLAMALTDPTFDGFKAGVPMAAVAGMTQYSEALAPRCPALFPPQKIVNSFGEIVAKQGIPQLRIAETEKYAHVTFFLNGGREDPFDKEDRILVPSPDVATYDLKPEMSAAEVTDKLVAAIRSGNYGAIIVNYANPDMVGHTGVLEAAIKAVETVDTCLGALETAIEKTGGVMLVTADHGNVELMRDQETGVPHTAHTHFDVPVVMVGGEAGQLKDGRLADLAPTLLELMAITPPAEMTGHSLLTGATSGFDGREAAE